MRGLTERRGGGGKHGRHSERGGGRREIQTRRNNGVRSFVFMTEILKTHNVLTTVCFPPWQFSNRSPSPPIRGRPDRDHRAPTPRPASVSLRPSLHFIQTHESQWGREINPPSSSRRRVVFFLLQFVSKTEWREKTTSSSSMLMRRNDEESWNNLNESKRENKMSLK